MYSRKLLLLIFGACLGAWSGQAKAVDCPYSGQRLSSGKLHRVLDQHLRWVVEQKTREVAAGKEKAERANLCNADLSGVDLGGRKLASANLAGANLNMAILDNIDLEEADLTEANLMGASLSHAVLQRAKLVKAQLLNANLANAVLTNADLFGSSLEGADMGGANLTGADLNEARFSNANLAGAVYEPRAGSLPNLPSLARAIGLNWLTFLVAVQPLEEVRSAFGKANLQEAAEAIDFAIQYSFYRRGELDKVSLHRLTDFRILELGTKYEQAVREGAFGQAIDYGRELLTNLPSTETSAIRQVQYELATLYLETRDFDKAEFYINEAIQSLQGELASSVASMSRSEARTYDEILHRIQSERKGGNEVQGSLTDSGNQNTLGQAKKYYEQKKDKQALGLIQGLIADLESPTDRFRSKQKEPILAEAYVTLAKIYASQGQTQNARRAFIEGIQRAYFYYQGLVTDTTEEQQFNLIQSANSAYFTFLSFVQQTSHYGANKHCTRTETRKDLSVNVEIDTEARLRDVYRIVLQLKGIVLESQLRVTQKLRAFLQWQATSTSTSALREKVERLDKLNGDISLAQSMPSANEGEIQSLSQTRNDLLLELSKSVAIFLEGEKKRQADRELRNSPLTPLIFVPGILIDVVRMQDFDFENRSAKSNWRYLVFLMNGEGEITLCDLNDATKIDVAVEKLRESLLDPNSTTVDKHARALYKLAFQPFRHVISNARDLYMAPDGALNLVPFGALVDEDGRYLIDRNSGYTFTYLSSGRDIQSKRQQPTVKAIEPVIFADPDYDLFPPDFTKPHWPRLLGTSDEAKAVEDVLTKKKLFKPILRRRGEATKNELLKILTRGAPAILHIATHGSFRADTSEGISENSMKLDVSRRMNLRGSPLLRSGLILAGANGNNPEDNGVLTALEISGLNLSATKIVVLSACETGVGDIRISEGVYGLRRALIQSQAETHVMSLWQVDDVVTSHLMTTYYNELLNGSGRPEALQEAQRAMVDRRHPYYWAAFISAGAWKPLSIDAGGEKK